jgi:hypothetical protein
MTVACFKVQSENLLGGSERNTKNLLSRYPSSDQDSNLGPLEVKQVC